MQGMLALCAFALSCYGWGNIAFALFYADRPPSHGYIVALGLVVLAFIGGVLNAIHLASGLSVAICAYVGILLGMLSLVLACRNIEWRSLFTPNLFTVWIFAFAVVSFAIFLTVTLLPTMIFNYDDDFLGYLPRIVQMRETGTLGGNPFELLGLSDFGTQSFFQALLMIWLPLTYAYAFDTIFCFVLGLWLLIEFGRSNKCTTTATTLATFIYIIINPQITNLSSVYSTTALVLALVVATRIFLEGLSHKETSQLRLALLAAPVGGILGTIVVIKLSNSVFALPFCGIIFSSAFIMYRWRGLVASSSAAITALTVAGLWAVAHADKFNVQLWHQLNTALDPTLAIYPNIAAAFHDNFNHYGGTRREFAVLVLALLISLAASLTSLFKRGRSNEHLLNIAASIGAISAFIGIAGGLINGKGADALRYSIPFLVAVTPLTIISTFCSARSSNEMWQKGFAIMTILCLVPVIWIFAGYSVHRFSRLVRSHSVVSFATPKPKQIAEVEAVVMSNGEQGYLQDIQSKLPVRSTVWAWVDAPFQLDFARNRIWNFSQTWFQAPWHLNFRNADELRQALVDRHVDYILWEYQSTLTRAANVAETNAESSIVPVSCVSESCVSQRTINLLLALQALASRFDVIFNDGRIVLISLHDTRDGPDEAVHPGQE
jgi:hypothetical protein